MHQIEKPLAIERCAIALEQLGQKSSSTEALAVDCVNYLYNELSDGIADPCALIRFFRTVQYEDLTTYLKGVVDKSLGGKPDPRTNCLTLLASRGRERAWNDRLQSAQHQVIPLTSPQMIEGAPMVAQLIKRLGIELNQVVEPSPTLFLNPKQKNYHVMYVPEALGDPSIVAQTQFVQPQNIRSVIGFGGLLPSGDMFAVLAFMRVHIPEETAKRFSKLASALELAITHLPKEHKYRAKILLADEEHSTDRLKRLLGSHHEIVEVTSMEAAQTVLQRENFDLIVCGTRFDDSRMFDLLRQVKQAKQQKLRPFICLRQNAPRIGKSLDASAPSAARLIGAACYLDAVRMSDGDLVNAIDAYLPKDIWISK